MVVTTRWPNTPFRCAEQDPRDISVKYQAHNGEYREIIHTEENTDPKAMTSGDGVCDSVPSAFEDVIKTFKLCMM